MPSSTGSSPGRRPGISARRTLASLPGSASGARGTGKLSLMIPSTTIAAFEQASTFQHSQGTARTPGSGQEPPGLIADQKMDHLSCAYSSVSRSSHNRPSRGMELCLEGSGFLLREKGNPRVISDLFLCTRPALLLLQSPRCLVGHDPQSVRMIRRRSRKRY